MSNQACLLAENTPDPVTPGDDSAEGARTLFVAGAAYRVPVFWLFCFDPEDQTEVESDDGPIPTLVAPMNRVRQRLAERDRRARDLFPQHTAVWEEWRVAVEAVDRKYLKADLYEIWMMCRDPNVFAVFLGQALDWLSGDRPVPDVLLGLAGIEDFDPETGTFPFDEANECVESFLYGWLEL